MSIGVKMCNTRVQFKGIDYWFIDTQDCDHVARYYAHRAAKQMKYIRALLGESDILLYVRWRRRMDMYFYWADDSNP